jgi:NAD-dependent dihydropyrimidine dehydrogenase PreA subunit
VVKIVHLRIDYNKCVGLLECYDVRLVDMFDAEEITEGKRVLVARPEDMLYIVPQLRKS